jgi:hypothetical protein
LLIDARRLDLPLIDSGHLLPWLGAALRGVVARRLKEDACLWSAAERDSRWKYCRGCPKMEQCDYGSTFESDPPADRRVLRAQADGQRPISLAPQYPVLTRARAGDSIQARLTLLGPAATASADAILDALRRAGAVDGLGPDRVRFTVQDFVAQRVTLSSRDLPSSPRDEPGVAPRVEVVLASPLLLKQENRGKGKPAPLLAPTFGDLLRASLRVVGRSFAAFGSGSLDELVDFAGLKQAALQVPTLSSDWSRFTQQRSSRRQGRSHLLVGVVGRAQFADVPAALIPWLMWGGRLGVGEFRVAGAGTWTTRVYR